MSWLSPWFLLFLVPLALFGCIATILAPAVSGDYYDFVEIDEHRLGILVADVSGHGVPAALLASMVKVALASQQGRADR